MNKIEIQNRIDELKAEIDNLKSELTLPDIPKEVIARIQSKNEHLRNDQDRSIKCKFEVIKEIYICLEDLLGEGKISTNDLLNIIRDNNEYSSEDIINYKKEYKINKQFKKYIDSIVNDINAVENEILAIAKKYKISYEQAWSYIK